MSVSRSQYYDGPEVKLASPPFYVRLAYLISLRSFQSFFAISLRLSRIFERKTSYLKPVVREYPNRRGLKNRIFRPEGKEYEPLPVYFDIHGGGFAVADPQTDDHFCSFLAKNFGILVVSVDYHKSPKHKFPCAVEDVAAIVGSVLQDRSLCIDGTKIAIGGFSAGGNLAFAASQMEELQGRIKGIVALYPVLDFTQTLEEKLKTRPMEAPSDILASSAGFIDWAYVPPDKDRMDPLLSPRWAKPENLPDSVFLVGAEYDMLCREAEDLAKDLAAASDDTTKTIISEKELPRKDGWGWQQSGIRFECARGREHAFTHITKWGKKEKDRIRVCESLYTRVGDWLVKNV
jgi:acetyl esterase/lipase